MPEHSLGDIKTDERHTYLNTSHPTIVTTRNNHTNLSGVTSMETKVNSSRQFLAHLRPVLLKISFCNCDDRPPNPRPRNKIPHCLSIPCFARSKLLPHFSSSLIRADEKEVETMATVAIVQQTLAHARVLTASIPCFASSLLPHLSTISTHFSSFWFLQMATQWQWWRWRRSWTKLLQITDFSPSPCLHNPLFKVSSSPFVHHFSSFLIWRNEAVVAMEMVPMAGRLFFFFLLLLHLLLVPIEHPLFYCSPVLLLLRFSTISPHFRLVLEARHRRCRWRRSADIPRIASRGIECQIM